MRKLLLASVLALLVPNIFAQPATSTEPNRIMGARLDVEYNQEQTTTTIHIRNLSNKTIDTVRVSFKNDKGGGGLTMFTVNLKPGESTTRNETNSIAMAAYLDAIVYADGTIETRNDAIANAIKEEERLAKEQHQRELANGKAFAVPNPLLHISPEEQIVRNYYAKLGFIAEVASLSQIMSQVTGGFSSRLTDAEAHALLEDHSLHSQ